MSTDLERQLARFAEALDREAPSVSVEEVVRRASTTVDDLDAVAEPRIVVELGPVPTSRRPLGPRPASKAVLCAAAVLLVVVAAVVAIGRPDDDVDVVDGVPALTRTFTSPRNGYSVDHPDGATITPAVEDGEEIFDVVDTGSDVVFKGTSEENHMDEVVIDEDDRLHPPDEQIDDHLAGEAFGGTCGVPRAEQPEIRIDGRPGRVAECANRIEATVTTGGKLYVFVLTHDRLDARAVFDAFVATIELTPETALHYPALRSSFVSPTYGYSYAYLDRGGLETASRRWEPATEPLDGRDDEPFDRFETGYGGYFFSASTAIPEGTAVDELVEEHVTSRAARGCGLPRDEQEPTTIDGVAGRIAECEGRIEAVVVTQGRLYLFRLYHGRSDGRDWFEAWLDTIELTPETAA